MKIASGAVNELPKSVDFNGDGIVNVRDDAVLAKNFAVKKNM